MKRLFEFIWTGCWHHWVTYERNDVAHKGTVIGQTAYCQCKKCGAHKRFNLYPTVWTA